MNSDQKKIIEEIANSLILPVSDLDPDSSLKDDLSLNPIEIADLFENLGNKFNIIFDPLEVEQTRTIKDLIELTEDKLLE